MTSFLAIVRVTLQQLMGRNRSIGFGLLSIVPATLLIFAARARTTDGLDTDLGAMLVAPFFSIVIPVTVLILAGSALGDERRDKTLSFLVLRPIGRLKIVVAKTLAATTASFVFALIGTVALTAVYALGGGNANVFPSIALGAAVTCLTYGGIFVLLGNVTTRPTVIGLLYILFIENGLAGEIPRLAALSPWRIGLSATLDVMPNDYPARALFGAIGELFPSTQNALLATAGVLVVTVALGTLLLRKTDAV